MKQLVIVMALFLLSSCRETPKATMEESQSPPEKKELAYPNALQNVFEAHGGLSKWKKQRTLSYELTEEDGAETQTIDLYSRMDKVEGPGYFLGYNGEDVWLLDPEEQFKGDAYFYHNLMFYFYAMPFVMADDGIVYGQAEDLQFGGKSYPGIKISYENGVGTSPKDEYYFYYDPESYTMAWLGYTVTYFSDSPSEDIHWIRYNDWSHVNGLLVPASISWYNYEGDTIKEPRSTVNFNNIHFSETPETEEFYSAPDGAKFVEAKAE